MIGRITTDGNKEPTRLLVCPSLFVGRDAEAARLAEALARPSAVVLIEGEAGVGKSRLLREFLASRAPQRRHHALVAGCPPVSPPLTLGPLTDALRQTADDVRNLPLSALAGALRALFPEWAAGLPRPPPSHSRTRLRRGPVVPRAGRVARPHDHRSARRRGRALGGRGHRGVPPVPHLPTAAAGQPGDDLPAGGPSGQLSPALAAAVRLPAEISRQRIPRSWPAERGPDGRDGGVDAPRRKGLEQFAAFLHAHTSGLPLAWSRCA